MSIAIPVNEKRTFKYGMLPNKLKYTIINDKHTDTSNVIMSIRTGSSYDPVEHMGMAHFLEHMLFMGSEKYPQENYFNKKISEYGGSTNAYTDMYETVYYMTFLSGYLDEMTDIFSRFFIDPLFNINAVEREINAVNSEHMKNLNSDMWINRQLIYDLTKPDSIMHKFSTGSLETLNGKKDYATLRAKMIEFYNKYYCSNNMCLTIVSNIDSDIVEDIIRKNFANIVMKEVVHPSFDEPKFTSTMNEYMIVPVNDTRYIIYFWEVPSIFNFLEDKIINVINYAITLNTENNLNNILIISKLSTGIDTFYLETGFYGLYVSIAPNVDIMKAIIKINSIVQNYLDNLHNMNWDYIYKYIIKEDLLNYENSPKESNLDLGLQISLNMHYYKVEQLYSAKKLILKHDTSKIYTTLEFLKFDKVNIIYGTNDKMISDGEEKLMEIYYKRPYYALSKSFITFPSKIFEPDMKLLFNMDLLKIRPEYISGLDIYNIPTKIYPNMWYGAVSHTHEPFVIGEIFINNKSFYDNILSSVISGIAINTINYYIGLLFFQEFNLGYIINLSHISLNGTITLVINGPNYNYIDIFNNILIKISSIDPHMKIINVVIDKIKENLLNISKMSPWSFINMITNELMYKYTYNYKARLDILKYITIPMVVERIKQLTNIIQKADTTDIITTIYGNITKKELKKCILNLSRDTYIVPITRDRPISDYTIKHPNSGEKNKCIQFLFLCNNKKIDLFDPTLTAQVILLNNLLERPVFDELRTKKQLGYLVSSGIIIDSNYYIHIKVQSEQDIDKVESIINEFIISFKTHLDKIKEEEYMSIIKSTYDLLVKKYTNMNEMASDYITDIYKRRFIFNRKQLIADKVRKTLLNDIKQLYHSIIRNKTIIKII